MPGASVCYTSDLNLLQILQVCRYAQGWRHEDAEGAATERTAEAARQAERRAARRARGKEARHRDRGGDGNSLPTPLSWPTAAHKLTHPRALVEAREGAARRGDGRLQGRGRGGGLEISRELESSTHLESSG